jgi:hypothetical protein
MPSLKELKGLLPFLKEPSEQEKIDEYNEKLGTTGPIKTRPTADLAYRRDKTSADSEKLIEDSEIIKGSGLYWPLTTGPYRALTESAERAFSIEPELRERARSQEFLTALAGKDANEAKELIKLRKMKGQYGPDEAIMEQLSPEELYRFLGGYGSRLRQNANADLYEEDQRKRDLKFKKIKDSLKK